MAPMIRQSDGELAIRATRAGLHDFTPQVRSWVTQSGIVLHLIGE